MFCAGSHPTYLKKEAGMNRVAKTACLFILCSIIYAGIIPYAQAQGRTPDAATVARRNATEKELESIAIIERKVMVPMRDGKRMQADIYRPKDQSKKYPIIFVRTPYNFNYWDVELGAPRDMTAELEAVKHGYAYIEMNERGRYFSEGDYDILGPPLTDSDDELDWMGGAAVVCGQGWPDRLLLHGGVAVGRGLARQQGPHHFYPGELRRRSRPRRSLLRAGQLVPRRRGADAFRLVALRLRT